MNNLASLRNTQSLGNLFNRSSFLEAAKNLFGDNVFNLDIDENTASNIYETKTEYVLEYQKSGIPQDKWNIEIKDGNVFIKAENKTENEEADEDKTYYRRSFQSVKINESYKIPSDVNSEGITAKYKDGVLKVILPKIITEQKASATKIKIT